MGELGGASQTWGSQMQMQLAALGREGRGAWSLKQEASDLGTVGKLGLQVRFKGGQSLLGVSASFQDRSLAYGEK